MKIWIVAIIAVAAIGVGYGICYLVNKEKTAAAPSAAPATV